MDAPILDFYAQPSGSVPADTDTRQPGEPVTVSELAEIVAESVVYDVVAGDFYGLDLPEERVEEIHIRSIDEMLARMQVTDLTGLERRDPQDRLVGRCHHYVRLMMEMLRAHRVPARARCGFAAYLNPPRFEDHWVCKYWDGDVERWRLVDSQFDGAWRSRLRLAFDPVDVPRDQFIVAAEAWRRCRRGEVDPDLFGISFVPLTGLWFVAGNLIRDAAALNRAQMLPWDAWGAQPQPDHEFTDAELAFFDHVAELTIDPDASFDELRRAYANEDRITVPPAVFNTLRNRPEPVPPPPGS